MVLDVQGEIEIAEASQQLAGMLRLEGDRFIKNLGQGLRRDHSIYQKNG